MKKTKSAFGFCSIHSKSKFRKEFKHHADWIGELRSITPITPVNNDEVDSSAPLLKAYATPHVELTEYLIRWADDTDDKLEALDRLVLTALERIVGLIPDATTLQEHVEGTYSFQEGNDLIQTKLQESSDPRIDSLQYHPDTVVKTIQNIVDETLPEKEFADMEIEAVRIRLDDVEFMSNLPLRIVAALLVTAWACEESNRGDLWFRKVHRYKPERPRRASAYMSATYYFMRRFAGCLEAQAKIIIRSMS